jgi:hypothetical protein
MADLKEKKTVLSFFKNEYPLYLALLTGIAFAFGYIAVNSFIPNNFVNSGLVNIKYYISGILFIVFSGIPLVFSYIVFYELNKKNVVANNPNDLVKNSPVEKTEGVEQNKNLQKRFSVPYYLIVYPIVYCAYVNFLPSISSIIVNKNGVLYLTMSTVTLLLLYLLIHFIYTKVKYSYGVFLRLIFGLYIVASFFIVYRLISFTLWYLITFIAIYFLIKITEYKTNRIMTSYLFLVTIIPSIVLFGVNVYPVINTNFGGGTPINITVVFSKETIENEQFKELYDSSKMYESKMLKLYDHSNGFLLVKYDSIFYHFKDDCINAIKANGNF